MECVIKKSSVSLILSIYIFLYFILLIKYFLKIHHFLPSILSFCYDKIIFRFSTINYISPDRIVKRHKIIHWDRKYTISFFLVKIKFRFIIFINIFFFHFVFFPLNFKQWHNKWETNFYFIEKRFFFCVVFVLCIIFFVWEKHVIASFNISTVRLKKI